MERPRARLSALRPRDDKVARRVLGALEERTAAYVPEGALLVFTLGAPIRTPKLLVEALTTHFREALARGVTAGDETAVVHENRVRFRIVGRADAACAVLGFVFSDDPDLDVLIAALTAAPARISESRRYDGAADA